jgi:hypothetical protein
MDKKWGRIHSKTEIWRRKQCSWSQHSVWPVSLRTMLVSQSYLFGWTRSHSIGSYHLSGFVIYHSVSGIVYLEWSSISSTRTQLQVQYWKRNNLRPKTGGEGETGGRCDEVGWCWWVEGYEDDVGHGWWWWRDGMVDGDVGEDVDGVVERGEVTTSSSSGACRRG